MRNPPSAASGATTRPSSGSPKKPPPKLTTSGLSNDLIKTYKVAPYIPSPRPRSAARTSLAPSSSSSCYREPEALQQDLHTARAQINELVYERKVLKTKTCALEEELRKMDARYEELLSINVITRTASASLAGSSVEIPEDKTIRNLRIALKNLTRRNKQQEKELAELKESMRFNKLYLKEQECIALFQETLKLRHALSNARAAAEENHLKAKPDVQAARNDLSDKLAAEQQDMKLLEGIGLNKASPFIPNPIYLFTHKVLAGAFLIYPPHITDTYKNLQTDNTALSTKLADAEIKSRLLEAELDKAERQWRSDIERERTELQAANDDMQKQIESMQFAHREAGNAAVDTETRLRGEVAAVRAELGVQAVKILEISSLLAGARERNDELEVQLATQRVEGDKLASALESAQQELSEFKRRRDDDNGKQAACREVKKGLYTTLRPFCAPTADINHSNRAEMEALKQSLSSTKQELDDYIRRNDDERAVHAREADKLARALAHAESQIEEQQRQLEETSKIRAKEVNEATALAQQSEQYRQALEMMTMRNEELQQQALSKTAPASTSQNTTQPSTLSQSESTHTAHGDNPLPTSQSQSQSAISHPSAAADIDVDSNTAYAEKDDDAGGTSSVSSPPKRSASTKSLKSVAITSPLPPSTSSSPSSKSGSRSRVNIPVKRAPTAAPSPPSSETLSAAEQQQQQQQQQRQHSPPDDNDEFRVHHLSRAVSTEFFEKQVQVDAAIAIQAAARGYLVRKYKRRRPVPDPASKAS
ncbi:hypothetical protein HDU86_007862 [Geranomyces michiganensis]|nr:hypothetical protein HDU86_007862 [Geranomyces michiganensis]